MRAWTGLVTSSLIACAPTTSLQDTASEAAPPWSAEGLEAQPRIDELRRRVPPELGYRPGTTEWRRAEASLQQRSTEFTAAEPGVLLHSLLPVLDEAHPLGGEVWERTVRLLSEEGGRAVGVVLEWGLMDDSLAGRDLRLHLVEREGSWRVERVEERFHCRRGITGEGLCA